MGEKLCKMLKCDRCGKEKILYWIKMQSGGEYEKYPSEWLSITQIGDLCDECGYTFKKWVTEFMNGEIFVGWDYRKTRNAKEIAERYGVEVE